MNENINEQTTDARRKAARASLDAFARNSTALVGIGANEAAAANLAYWQAKKQRLSEEDAARLMERALKGSDAMKRDAFNSEFESEFKRGVLWDVVAGTVPAALILLVVWVVAFAMQSTIEFRYVAVCAVALLGAAAFLGGVLLRPASPRWAIRTLGFVSHGDSTALAGSVGAFAVGALVLATGGAFLSQLTKDQQRAKVNELSVELKKVDAALAMTLAARSVNAEPKHVSELVAGTTGLDWTVARKGGDGDVLARAKLQDGQAVVRYVPLSKTNEGMLQTELVLAGRPAAVRRYLYGTVEAPVGGQPSSLRQLYLRLDESSTLAVLTLPDNTLPPAPGTVILAREKAKGVIESIQSVDGVRQSLLQTAASAGPSN